jgi:hypothetical protein
MFAEQDRIEEEADRFDAGDLERLRKMAKGASRLSVSEDIELTLRSCTPTQLPPRNPSLELTPICSPSLSPPYTYSTLSIISFAREAKR